MNGKYSVYFYSKNVGFYTFAELIMEPYADIREALESLMR
jgi:intein-encoded DNA endonuclease-like protein